MGYSLKDFRIHIPPDLIAQHPSPRREDARLLVYDLGAERIIDDRFGNIGAYLGTGDLVVYNDARVIPARLQGRKQPTGAAVELLLTRKLDGKEWVALVKPARRIGGGTRVSFTGGLGLEVIRGEGEGEFRVRFDRPIDYGDLEGIGAVPLPGYIRREPEPSDRERYQTVYARRPGAVAAPTAGLHFTKRIITGLRERDVEFAPVTLYVGPGTFAPVREPDYRSHRMHAERYEIPEDTARAVNRGRKQGRRIVCVGTTSVRAVEAAADHRGMIRPGSGETTLYIYPGYRFKATGALITNFHLPDSTLILLVAAFAGKERIEKAYGHAVRARYRFYSYGDAMFLCNPPAGGG
ncbi:MAG: tRNA preQ1(34) S-adenosylmethionine ribosyltransferase-isomerase QueA [Spirochaetota bacterium]